MKLPLYKFQSIIFIISIPAQIFVDGWVLNRLSPDIAVIIAFFISILMLTISGILTLIILHEGKV